MCQRLLSCQVLVEFEEPGEELIPDELVISSTTTRYD